MISMFRTIDMTDVNMQLFSVQKISPIYKNHTMRLNIISNTPCKFQRIAKIQWIHEFYKLFYNYSYNGTVFLIHKVKIYDKYKTNKGAVHPDENI